MWTAGPPLKCGLDKFLVRVPHSYGMKICNKCGTVQPLSEFGLNRNTCKGCKREANKLWYQQNADYQKTKVKKRNKRHRKEVSLWYKEYKNNQACCLCGETCSACLEFHHTDKNKEFNISDAAIKGSLSIRRIEREIAKCVVLCSNCHKKIHAGVLVLPG